MLADCISKHCFISVQKHKLNRSGFIITGKTWISWYNKGLNLMIFQKDFKCLWFPEHNWNRIYMNRTDFKRILAIIKQRQTTKGLHKTFLLSKMDSDELKKTISAEERIQNILLCKRITLMHSECVSEVHSLFVFHILHAFILIFFPQTAKPI